MRYRDIAILNDSVMFCHASLILSHLVAVAIVIILNIHLRQHI